MTDLEVIQGDITKLEVDAIVNAANSALRGGGGVDGAIHAVGGPSIAEECRAIVSERGPCPTGSAVVTGAGRLPARYVIHAVGPIWRTVSDREAANLLGSCYRESLDLAVGRSCRTIAFPNISTGVYGFPKESAAAIALDAVRSWLADNPARLDRVAFVCFDPENHGIYRRLLEY